MSKKSSQRTKSDRLVAVWLEHFLYTHMRTQRNNQVHTLCCQTDEIISSLVMLSLAIIFVVAILNVLYRPILTLKEVVLDLSKGNGDLTRRLPVTSDDDLGQISGGINAFIANLQSLMLEVSQSSEHIASSVGQLKKNKQTRTTKC